MFVQRASVFFILLLFLVACTQPKEPDPSLVRLAALATLESRPTLQPVVVEVTRMVAVVPQPATLPTEPRTDLPRVQLSEQPERRPLAKTKLKDIASAELLQTLGATPAPAQFVDDASAPVSTAPVLSMQYSAMQDNAMQDTGTAADAAAGRTVSAAKVPAELVESAPPALEKHTPTEPVPVKVAEPESGICAQRSDRGYELVDMEAADTNHPDYLHGDLNLALRNPTPVDSALTLVGYSGGTDGNAPKLNGLFVDGRTPTFTSAYQVYGWNWDCNDHGCPDTLLNQFDAGLIGMATSPGEEIRIPSRGPEIYGGGYIAALLYADESQVTVAYSRDGTVANGYAAHITGLCVDPNLLARYQEGHNGGRRQLPLLRNEQLIGTAAAGEIQVAIRDRGKFMDPRSKKDWWR